MRLDGKTADLTGWFESYGLPPFEPEYRFHPVRRWRFDYANKAYKVAVEINGGIWTHGRHIRGSGYIGDRTKINAAQNMGWVVLEFSPSQIKTGEAFTSIREALDSRTPHPGGPCYNSSHVGSRLETPEKHRIGSDGEESPITVEVGKEVAPRRRRIPKNERNQDSELPILP